MVVGNDEAIDWRQLVIAVERWRVTGRAAFTLEDALTAGGSLVEAIRILRRLQRIEILGEGVELLIAISAARRGIRQLRETRRISWNESVVIRKRITTVHDAAVHRSVSHQISDRTMLLEPGAIEIPAILDADEVGHLDWQERTCSMPGNHARRICAL